MDVRIAPDAATAAQVAAGFIARVLRSHTGKRWAMRLRPLDLTRRWLEEAGFVVEDVTMERLGIFGVLRARKAVDDGDDL